MATLTPERLAEEQATAADAAEAIRENGQPLTIARFDETGGYDPETSSVTDAADQTADGFGVALEYSLREVGDGSLIRMEDQRIYIGPDIALSPKPGDRITLADGRHFSVIHSRPLAPAGVVLLHEVQARTL